MSCKWPIGVATTYNDGVLERGASARLMRDLMKRIRTAIVRPAAGTGQAGVGAAAEAAAERYLQARGLRTIERNFHCRGGEVDLVCRDGETLVFVEVRLRRRNDFGGAAASITQRKQQRIVLAARHWLAQAGSRAANAPCRFDVVLMSGLDEACTEWIQGAFDAD